MKELSDKYIETCTRLLNEDSAKLRDLAKRYSSERDIPYCFVLDIIMQATSIETETQRGIFNAYVEYSESLRQLLNK